ncbi:long-chain-fatty-acid--CoA ligase [uncultured Nevskia sp.]|uniref:long-chain-fatty-acid--CoA ligase n=1 Tax=uncultured Nevskia sp. TaxID=228950 RepID=UPI0025D5694A|nr:long-chain-fatty-acid--CoA ligase [uncultured Nevskia sp.]
MWLYADIKTLADIPRLYARTRPTKVALVDGSGTTTFAELDDRSNRIANLIAGLGVAPRSNVGFLGKNSSLYFQLLFGINKAGSTMSPMNWRLAAPELAAVIADAEAPLLFVDRELMPLAESVKALCSQKFQIVEIDPPNPNSAFDQALAKAANTDPHAPLTAEQAALLIYTSGTTGKPKGVELTHRGFHYMRLCEHLEPALQWQPDDVMLMVMPNFHLVGSGLTIQSLYNGSTLSILPQLDAGQLIKIIARDRPSVVALVPTAIQMLLDHPDSKTADFSSLRLVMYAGSPISSHLLQRALVQMKCKFMQFYGATESSGAITLLRPEQHVLEDEAKLKSCGTPLPLIEVKFVDAFGVEVPDGEVGELIVRSPSIFGGYWKQPETTAAVLKDGWYKTGDAGRRDAEGLLYLVDRVKDMIVTGGENVYSAEVEQVLAKHPGVRMCAVIGLPDEKWGERVVALIMPADGHKPTQDEIITHCRQHIAGYKVPKEVRLVDSFPMTATGKVLKRVVRDELAKAAAVA